MCLCSKRLFLVVGYLYVTFAFLMYAYSVEMDSMAAAKVYMIINNVAAHFLVQAQHHWIVSTVIYGGVPFYFWYELTEKLGEEVVTEMYYLQA